MSIEERIEKHYLARLKEYDDEIGKAIEILLGSEVKQLYDTRKDGFRPVFIASKEGVEYHLNNTPTAEEKEVLEYLLEEMERTGKDFVTINDHLKDEGDNKNYYEFLNSSEHYRTYIYYHVGLNKYYSYFKMDIFTWKRNGLEVDILFFFRLFEFLFISYIDFLNKQWICPHNKLINIDGFGDIDASFKIFINIISTLALQIVSLLRQKGIYLFDEENDYNLENAVGRYNMVNPKFISAFQRLLPMYLLEPSKFIELVGIDNFRDFIICTLDENSDLDIDDIINRMILERDKKASYEMTITNLPLLIKAKHKVDEDKAKALELEKSLGEQEVRIDTQISRAAVGINRSGRRSGIDSLENRGLIYNNLSKINNIKEPNLKIDDDSWKYGGKGR